MMPIPGMYTACLFSAPSKLYVAGLSSLSCSTSWICFFPGPLFDSLTLFYFLFDCSRPKSSVLISASSYLSRIGSYFDLNTDPPFTFSFLASDASSFFKWSLALPRLSLLSICYRVALFKELWTARGLWPIWSACFKKLSLEKVLMFCMGTSGTLDKTLSLRVGVNLVKWLLRLLGFISGDSCWVSRP